MDNGITVDNLMSVLPNMLKSSTKSKAVAYAIAKQLVKISDLADKVSIYSSLSSISEDLADLLAEDFKIGWWGQDFSLSEKRQLLQKTWNIYRHLGTKMAIKEGVSAVYDGADVEEWFDYGGEPFHFKVLIDSAYQGGDTSKYNKVIKNINLLKNARSVLDSIEWVDLSASATFYLNAGVASVSIIDGCTANNYA